MRGPLILLEADGRQYLSFARRQLEALSRLRRDVALPSMQKQFAIGSSHIWLKSSDYGDIIRITGGARDAHALYSASTKTFVVTNHVGVKLGETVSEPLTGALMRGVSIEGRLVAFTDDTFGAEKLRVSTKQEAMVVHDPGANTPPASFALDGTLQHTLGYDGRFGVFVTGSGLMIWQEGAGARWFNPPESAFDGASVLGGGPTSQWAMSPDGRKIAWERFTGGGASAVGTIHQVTIGQPDTYQVVVTVGPGAVVTGLGYSRSGALVYAYTGFTGVQLDDNHFVQVGGTASVGTPPFLGGGILGNRQLSADGRVWWGTDGASSFRRVVAGAIELIAMPDADLRIPLATSKDGASVVYQNSATADYGVWRPDVGFVEPLTRPVGTEMTPLFPPGGSNWAIDDSGRVHYLPRVGGKHYAWDYVDDPAPAYVLDAGNTVHAPLGSLDQYANTYGVGAPG